MFKGVLDELGVTMIGKASGELPNDTGEFLGLAEQQAAAVGRDVAAIKRGEDFGGSQGEGNPDNSSRTREDRPASSADVEPDRSSVCAVVGLPCSDSLLYTLSSSGCLSY